MATADHTLTSVRRDRWLHHSGPGELVQGRWGPGRGGAGHGGAGGAGRSALAQAGQLALRGALLCNGPTARRVSRRAGPGRSAAHRALHFASTRLVLVHALVEDQRDDLTRSLDAGRWHRAQSTDNRMGMVTGPTQHTANLPVKPFTTIITLSVSLDVSLSGHLSVSVCLSVAKNYRVDICARHLMHMR